MSVRAKFKLDHVEISLQPQSRQKDDGTWEQLPPKEMRTLVFNPVYSPDPDSENRKFWDATPSGQFRLGTVNPEAWTQFDIGKEYFIDISEAA